MTSLKKLLLASTVFITCASFPASKAVADYGSVYFATSATQTDNIDYWASVLTNVFNDNGNNNFNIGPATFGTITDDSYLLNLTPVFDGNNVDILISLAPINDVATTPSNAVIGNVLLSGMENSTNEQISQIQSLLFLAPTKKAVNEILESATPPTDGGNVAATQIFTTQVANITNTHLAMLRDDSNRPLTGLSAGDPFAGLNFWIQGFGTHGDQGTRDGVAGYNVNSLGTALGVDTESLGDKTTLGIGFSYAGTVVDSDSAADAKTEINSFQVSVYGDYDFDSHVYLSGQLGYTRSTNETTRHIAGLTAKGDYDSHQIQARAEAGKKFAAGAARITPKILADYSHYKAEDYTETGAGGANVSVSQNGVDTFNVGAGLDTSWNFARASGSYIEPALYGLVRYDVANNSIQSTNQFVAGGPEFQTTGATPARTALDVGANLTYYAVNNWDFKAGYNFEIKEDYTSHSGLLKAAYKF